MSFLKVILTISFLLFASTAKADYYRVYVQSVDDLYKTDSGFYIETTYCFHDSWGEKAILKYEEYGYDNKIIFDNGTSCEVERVFR